MPRASMSAYLEMAKQRDAVRKDAENLRCLSGILDGMREFLDIPRAEIKDATEQCIANSTVEPRSLMDMVGILPDVHYLRVTSESCSLVKVLYDVQETTVWRTFLKCLEESPVQQATLIFTLKGRTTMVLTNKGITPYPGCYFHKIVSSDQTQNDVYLMPVAQVPMFMQQHQFR